MEHPKIIDFNEAKNKILVDKNRRIESGEYFKAGESYPFHHSVRVLVVPTGEEMGGGANIPIPAELPPGNYICLGYDSDEKAYKFRGRPVGFEDVENILIEVITLLE